MKKKIVIVLCTTLAIIILMLLVIKNNEISFVKNLKESFYNNIILKNRYKIILKGLENTLLISTLSAIFGSLLAGIVCAIHMQKNMILQFIAKIYVSFIRNIPVMLLIMFSYYLIFASSKLSAITVSIITFSVYFSAFASEIFRAGINAVGDGQIEAGIAVGFTKIQAYRHIVFPQAIRIIFPVYKGEFITLIKITSVLGYVGVQDLTRATELIRGQTFDAFFPLLISLVLYFLIIGLLLLILNTIERLINPERKSVK